LLYNYIRKWFPTPLTQGYLPHMVFSAWERRSLFTIHVLFLWGHSVPAWIHLICNNGGFHPNHLQSSACIQSLTSFSAITTASTSTVQCITFTAISEQTGDKFNYFHAKHEIPRLKTLDVYKLHLIRNGIGSQNVFRRISTLKLRNYWWGSNNRNNKLWRKYTNKSMGFKQKQHTKG